ncbi:MAG TPA: SDR family NAD(P)-dependent oxidoreductase [Pseudolabrys sp.]|nr:SDR family NAD(P)-dependent oxidoreductase [Pseudolabrys sp.]
MFAVEYALSELWRSFGIVPNIVAGHSVGEYVAACIAGVFSLEDALALVARRGALMQSLPAGGAMAAVFAPEGRVAPALALYAGRVAVAGVNGPAQTVISGHRADVEAICRQLTADGIRCQSLPVSHAFHSPLVDPVLDEFERTVAGIRLSAPQLRLVSNLTGRLATAQEVTQPAYWRRHMREAVRFGDCLATIAAARVDCCIEIGPQPTLLSFAGAAFGETACAFVPSLRKGRDDKGRDDLQQMLESVAAVYRCGARVDWRGVAQERRRIVDLPTYPFQRQSYWFKAKPQRAVVTARVGAVRHPLLGGRLRTAAPEAIYETQLAADTPPFVRDHRVAGRIALPATAYLDMLLAAGAERLGHASNGQTTCLDDVVIREAMLFDDDGGVRVVQTVCGAPRDGIAAVSISSLDDNGDAGGDWTQHVTASVRCATMAFDGPALAQLRAQCPRPVAPADHYADLARRGIEFGAAFHVVRQLWRGEAQALGEIALDDGADIAAYQMHPLLLDGCLQVIAAALPTQDDPDAIYLPIGIGRYALARRPGSRCFSHVAIRSAAGDSCVADLRLFDEAGAVIGVLDAVALKRVTRDALARLGERRDRPKSGAQWLDDSLYRIAWRAAPPVDLRALPMPEPAMLATTATAQLDALRVSARLADYEATHRGLETLCIDYVVQAMRDLGWRPVTGATVKPDELAMQLRVLPRHRRLFGRLLAILGEAGWLTPQPAGGWRVMRAFDELPQGDGLANRLALMIAQAPPGGAAEIELTGRVAGELAAALRGDCDPMQLLFPGGSTETAEALYRDAPTAQVFNGLMAEVIAQAAAAAREGRALRILEIGAGTGGTTARVAPRLPREGVEYTFTDVGPAFVTRARERFADHPAMHFAVLDLEREPDEQGFADRRFDIVIAANVIHATADLHRTLARVRRLLMPGGLLAMLEVTAPQRWFDLTVGLTEGWWAFTDTALRPDYATLPRARWLRMLPECGFDALVALPEGEQQGALALQSLFLARADARVVRASPRHWLILADRRGIAATLALQLRAAGDLVTLAAPEGGVADARTHRIQPQSADAIRRLLADLRKAGLPVSGVIHAWSLDAENDDPAAANAGAVGALMLAQALAAEAAPPRLWFVTRGAQPADAQDRAVSPAAAPLWGLAKTLTLEHPELKCVCVDLDPVETMAGLDLLAAELDADGSEPQVALRGGARRVARLARQLAADDANNNVPETPWRLVPAVPGVLDRFDHAPLPARAPGAGEVQIAVAATGLNFKDVLNVLGLYPGDPGPLGGECAGTVVAVGAGVAHVKPGDRVMAVAGGSFASHVVARAELVQPVPAGMSAAEAAAFPIAFLTAAFCLSHLAGLRAGERVLIHAGAGGVGMAAVRLAQRAGAEIFATAGAPWKREMLHAMGVAHVLDSRSDGFADAILAATGGRGVDVVLNSLAGATIDASFKALARGGRFVEIGKRDIKTPQWVDALNRGIRYFVVDWGETAAQQPDLIGGLFAQLSDDLRNGALVSLPRHVFPLADTASAFRLMAEARHAGKVVVTHRLHNVTPVRRDGTYLVTGGLSGLGLLTVRWLAEQGAGRVVAVGRRAATPDNEAVLKALAAKGTAIVTEQLDVTDAGVLRELLRRIHSDGPPLRGIVHSAGRLDDAALMQQSADTFAHVLGPKVTGAALLDTLTRGDPLDWLVFYSSIAAVLGSPGQANHSAANAFLDALAQRRRGEGRPALSINWGGWSEIGAAADRAVIERLAQQGLGALSPDQGIAALSHLLHDNGERTGAQTVVLPADWSRHVAQGLSPARAALLAEVVDEAPRAAPAPKVDAAKPNAPDLAGQLADAPAARKRIVLATFVRERALQTLGLDASRAVDPRTPLGELGLDSLLSVELRNRLSAAVGKPLPATLLFDHPTIDALTDHLAGVLGLNAQSAGQAAGDAAARTEDSVARQPSPGLVEAIEDLSDEDVERLYAARMQAKGAS